MLGGKVHLAGNSALYVAMLILGSAATLAKKSQNDLFAYDRKGNYLPFLHPWLQTTTMFIGEFSCFFGFIFFYYRERRRNFHASMQIEPFLCAVNTTATYSLQRQWFQWRLVLPASMELLGSGVSCVGLIYISASVWQMLQGSIIVFTTFLRKLCFGRSPGPYQYVALLLVVAGLMLVCIAAVLVEPRSAEDTVFGIVFTIIGQLFIALQMMLEEKQFTDKNFHPLHVLGMEGFLGFVLMVCIVLPVTTALPSSPSEDTNFKNVFHDNVFDGLFMMGNNLNILYLGIIYLLSTMGYSMLGTVAVKMSKTRIALAESIRAAVVWCFELLIFSIGASNVGQRLTNYSLIQLGGFIFLLLGSLIFNKVFLLRPWWYCMNVDQISTSIETPSSRISSLRFLPYSTPSLARVCSGSPSTRRDVLGKQLAVTLSDPQVVV